MSLPTRFAAEADRSEFSGPARFDEGHGLSLLAAHAVGMFAAVLRTNLAKDVSDRGRGGFV
jgi:hypothetical protein